RQTDRLLRHAQHPGGDPHGRQGRADDLRPRDGADDRRVRLPAPARLLQPRRERGLLRPRAHALGGAARGDAEPPRGPQTMRSFMGRFAGGGLELISPVVVLVIWQILSKAGIIDDRFWPAPTDIIDQLYDGLVHGSLLDDTLLTTGRLAIGLAIGGVLGL